jgi:hypothetical protein
VTSIAAHADGTTPAILEDASMRVSLFSAANASAGSGSKLLIVSDDGSAKMQFKGQMQIRHMVNHREGVTPENEHGFDSRRIRPKLAGSLQNGKIPFSLIGDGRKGAFTLVDAWMGYVPGEGQRVRVGQYAAPFSREEMLSSSKRLASDYSIANAAFTIDRSQGIEYRSRGEDWTTYFFVGDGVKELNTPFNAGSDYGVNVRAERKFGGTWKRFDDFVGWKGEETATLVGAAVHISGGQIDADSDGMFDDDFYDFRYTVDAGVEGDGWNAFAAFFGQNMDAQGMSEINSFGMTLQGGVFITDDIDVFTQYAWADDDADLGELSVLTVGFNKYISGHVIKLTVDASYAFEEITSRYDNSSRAFLVDSMGEDGQIVIRTQLQLLF